MAAAIAALPRKTSDGLPVEMGLDIDKDLKVTGGTGRRRPGDDRRVTRGFARGSAL